MLTPFSILARLFAQALCAASLGTPHTRSFFYVGGRYTPRGNEMILTGQMYVEALSPRKVAQQWPVLIIPGNGMSGTNFLNTPDGRPGWADFLLARGYVVYIVDQPSRGRSPWQNGNDGPQTTFSAERIEQRFMATRLHNLWPQASRHTQWPGNGSVGDETFDAFYSSVVPTLVSSLEMAENMRHAGAFLLDRIGPVVLLTHSHSGQYGWILGDIRPKQVKAVIALEPLGPPFIDAVFPPFAESRPFGLTDLPLDFDPPISAAADIQKVVSYAGPLLTCYRQMDPPRPLKNLKDIPVLMLTSESGYHAVYDNCTAEFLRQAGVRVDHVRLEEVGIHGNGHMLFMEKNNMEIAREVLMPWMERWGLVTAKTGAPVAIPADSTLSMMRGNRVGLSDSILCHQEL